MTTLYLNGATEVRAIAFDDDKRDFVIIQRDNEIIEDFKKRAEFVLRPNRIEALKIAYMNPYK